MHVFLLFMSFSLKEELSLAAVHIIQLVWKGQLQIYGQSKKATFSFRKDTVIDGLDSGARNCSLLWRHSLYCLYLNNGETWPLSKTDYVQKKLVPLKVMSGMPFFLICFPLFCCWFTLQINLVYLPSLAATLPTLGLCNRNSLLLLLILIKCH